MGLIRPRKSRLQGDLFHNAKIHTLIGKTEIKVRLSTDSNISSQNNNNNNNNIIKDLEGHILDNSYQDYILDLGDDIYLHEESECEEIN